jgi:hypothetical protein
MAYFVAQLIGSKTVKMDRRGEKARKGRGEESNGQ